MGDALRISAVHCRLPRLPQAIGSCCAPAEKNQFSIWVKMAEIMMRLHSRSFGPLTYHEAIFGSPSFESCAADRGRWLTIAIRTAGLSYSNLNTAATAHMGKPGLCESVKAVSSQKRCGLNSLGGIDFFVAPRNKPHSSRCELQRRTGTTATNIGDAMTTLPCSARSI